MLFKHNISYSCQSGIFQRCLIIFTFRFPFSLFHLIFNGVFELVFASFVPLIWSCAVLFCLLPLYGNVDVYVVSNNEVEQRGMIRSVTCTTDNFVVLRWDHYIILGSNSVKKGWQLLNLLIEAEHTSWMDERKDWLRLGRSRYINEKFFTSLCDGRSGK